MTAPEPLSAEERSSLVRWATKGKARDTQDGREIRCWEATVRQAEQRAEQAEAERDALREALAEIASPPDANGPHENYGCLDLHEARTIARAALESR